MRIYLGRDYYDSAMAFGRDEELLFIRKPREFTNCPIVIPNNNLQIRKKSDRPAYLKQYNWVRDVYLTNCGFVIAGKLYPCVEIYTFGKGPHYAFSEDEVVEFLNQRQMEINKRRYNDAPLSEVFAQKLNERQHNWLVENRITTLRAELASTNHDTRYIKHWVADAPDLKKFGLQRILPPFQAHQEISMWLGGVLPRNPNPMVQITDPKVQAHKAGFDKWSFRKIGIKSKVTV